MGTSLAMLRATYQQAHDDRGLGGNARMIDDGTGLVGFFNLRSAVWEWFRWDTKAHQYVLSGTTDFAL